VNQVPITVAAGHWSFQDLPIGAPADPNGTKYPVVLVLADARCTASLAAIGPSGSGEETLAELPAGCRIADRVTLVRAG
jgi:ABC-type protease/lipase transport system fused ATPase/permease subunit